MADEEDSVGCMESLDPIGAFGEFLEETFDSVVHLAFALEGDEGGEVGVETLRIR
jgi:hypothetical protein